jgi:hypothetical protein
VKFVAASSIDIDSVAVKISVFVRGGGGAASVVSLDGEKVKQMVEKETSEKSSSKTAGKRAASVSSGLQLKGSRAPAARCVHAAQQEDSRDFRS